MTTIRSLDRRILGALGLSLILHVALLGIHAALRPLLDRADSSASARFDIRLKPTPKPVPLPPLTNRLTNSVSAPDSPLRVARRRPDQATDNHRITVDRQDANSAEHSPNNEASAPSPSIDYAAAREIARQTARSHDTPQKTELLRATPPVEPETDLGRRINQAAHPDCRTRYAGAGLLAIPLLINDAVRDGGCKW